jgi:hypothetical protein
VLTCLDQTLGAGESRGFGAMLQKSRTTDGGIFAWSLSAVSVRRVSPVGNEIVGRGTPSLIRPRASNMPRDAALPDDLCEIETPIHFLDAKPIIVPQY